MLLSAKIWPQYFDEIVGNEELVRILETEISQGTYRSVLLIGQSGCGKTAIAEIYAREILCTAAASDRPCQVAMSDSDPKPCRDCRDWFRGRRHSNFSLLSGGQADEAQVAAAIAASLRTESASDGRAVVLLDRADRFSSATFDAIREQVARVINTTLIVCADEYDKLPSKMRDLFLEFRLSSASVPARVDFIKRICLAQGWISGEARDRTGPVNEAIQLIAELGGGRLQKLARDVDAIVTRYGLSPDGVREFYKVGAPSFGQVYLRSALAASPLVVVKDELGSWDATPSEKIAAIEHALLQPFLTECSGTEKRKSATAASASNHSDSLHELLLVRARQLGFAPQEFWAKAFAHWRPIPEATNSTLLERAISFQRWLVHKDQGAAQRPAPKSRASYGKPQLRPHSQPHLDLGNIRRLWDAASFMVQKHRVLFNARIVVWHNRLRVPRPGEFVTSLLHELKMRSAAPIRWVYVHEHSSKHGLRTVIVAHLPDEGRNAEVWLEQSFLQRMAPTRERMALKFGNASGYDEFAYHLRLLKYVSGGLDPLCLVRSAAGRSPLIDLLEVPSRYRRTVGNEGIAQRVGVSRSISRGVRDKERLVFVSAFAEGAWSALASGHDSQEAEHRLVCEAQIATEQEIVPDGSGRPHESRRDARIQEICRRWVDDAKLRLSRHVSVRS